MELIDTHAHIDDDQFDQIRAAVLERCRIAGVSTVIAVGTTLEASRKCVRLAEENEMLFAAVGIQPNYCAEAEENDWQEICQLSKHPSVVAIGETGLDRYWDHTPFDIQRDYFERHIRLASDRDLPFIVHMRDCGDEIVEVLQEQRKCGEWQGVMHSFTGDEKLADRCLGLGMYISFAGMVTFKKSLDLRTVARQVPLDRILIETDSPYLSPHPKRGQRPNEPSLLVHTAKCLATERSNELEEFARTTSANARRLFSKLPSESSNS